MLIRDVHAQIAERLCGAEEEVVRGLRVGRHAGKSRHVRLIDHLPNRRSGKTFSLITRSEGVDVLNLGEAVGLVVGSLRRVVRVLAEERKTAEVARLDRDDVVHDGRTLERSEKRCVGGVRSHRIHAGGGPLRVSAGGSKEPRDTTESDFPDALRASDDEGLAGEEGPFARVVVNGARGRVKARLKYEANIAVRTEFLFATNAPQRGNVCAGIHRERRVFAATVLVIEASVDLTVKLDVGGLGAKSGRSAGERNGKVEMTNFHFCLTGKG